MNIGWLLFSFKNRVNRAVYIISSILLFVAIEALLVWDESPHSLATTLLLFLLAIVLIWATLALQAKRWHDLDKSAWWILANLVPIIGTLFVLIMTLFIKGTKGDNRFGADPLKNSGK